MSAGVAVREKGMSEAVSVYLLDIEGTTTSVGFVFDVLFPFARQHVAGFLAANGATPEVEATLALLAADALRERAAGEDCPEVVTGASRLESATAAMLWMMDRDRKTQGLKRLQGQIWRAGYEQGTLESDVFDDVPVALRKWRAAGARVFIYSSGSVPAQQLLFRYSRCGDLTPLLDGYFDTGVGEKRAASSYTRILEEVGAKGSEVLFVTDIVAEADAAVAAGMRVCVAVRPGNASQSEHGYPVSSRFDQL